MPPPGLRSNFESSHIILQLARSAHPIFALIYLGLLAFFYSFRPLKRYSEGLQAYRVFLESSGYFLGLGTGILKCPCSVLCVILMAALLAVPRQR